MSEENELEVELGVSIEGLQEGIEQAKAAIESLSEPVKGVIDSFGELGEAFLAALAVEKIEEFADRMGELGEATERMSKILGVSTEEIGQLNYAAALTGTSTDNLAQMMGRFEAGLSEAEKGTGRMAAGLRSLGLSAKELSDVNPSQQLREIAEAVSKVGDGAAKAAALQDLGRGFVQLIPLLDEGGEGFDELKDKANEAGVVLDAVTTGRLVEMQHGMVGLKEQILGATIEGFKPFIDVVNVAVGFMSDLAKAFIDSAAHGGAVKQVLDSLADGFRVIEQLVADTIAAVKIFGATIEYTITVAKAKFDELGNAIIGVVNDLAHLDLGFSHTAAAAHEGAQDAAAAWKQAAATIKSAMDENAEAQAKIWKGSPLAAAFGYRPGVDPRSGEAAGVPTGGSDSSFKPQPPMPVEQTAGKKDDSAFKAAEEEAAAEIKLWTDAAAQRESILDGEWKRHQVTTAQWLAGTKDALADELQDTIATYQAEIQAGNLKGQPLKAVQDKIAEAEAANAVKVEKAEQKAADETTKSWMTAADQIASIMNSQVDALLKGTESIAMAFKKMAASVIEDLIQIAIKMTAEHAAMGLMGLFGGGGAGGTSAAGVGTFANGFGSAPTFGGSGGDTVNPLAAAMGLNTVATLANTLATNAAAVASFFHIPGFAEGTDYIGQTGLALVHQGEMVVPSHMNPNNPRNSISSGSFSNPGPSGGDNAGGSSGGSVTNHHNSFGDIHVHNTGRELDPDSVASAVKQAMKGGHFNRR